MCEQKNISPKYLVCFLIALTCVGIAFIFLITWSNVQFRESRISLTEVLNTHVVNTNGLLDSSQELYANHRKCVIEGLYNLLDSLSRQPIKNQKVLVSSLKSCLDEMKDIQGVLSDSELRHEFEIMKNDIDVTLEYLNSHMQLHIDKMNNTVSTFELWAAVLTIIFLVFSFYSLYKVDELVKQGREGVDYIEKLKDEGNDSIKSFNKESADALTETKKQVKEALDEQSQLLSDKYKLLEDSLKDRIDKAQLSVEDAMFNFSQYKSQVELENEKIVEQMVQLEKKSKEVLAELEKVVDKVSSNSNDSNHG